MQNCYLFCLCLSFRLKVKKRYLFLKKKSGIFSFRVNDILTSILSALHSFLTLPNDVLKRKKGTFFWFQAISFKAQKGTFFAVGSDVVPFFFSFVFLSLDLPLSLLSMSVKKLTWFSCKKRLDLTYSCQFIFIWMTYITGIFHVHKLPCLSIVSSKYDIWDLLPYMYSCRRKRDVWTVTWLLQFLASIS